MNQAVALLFIVICSLFGCIHSHFYLPPKTVDSLNVNAYMGRWFQMYTSLIPTLTYEKNGYCITADYALSSSVLLMTNNMTMKGTEVSFSVFNSIRVGSASGNLDQVTGAASNAYFDQIPGKFIVTMNDTHNTVFPYWIVAVGPLEVVDSPLYPWAVVSDPGGLDLFILTRDITSFDAKYGEEVLQLVEAMGFKWFFNKPIETFQSVEECEYPPLPAAASIA